MPRSQFPGRCSGTTEGFFFSCQAAYSGGCVGTRKMQEKEKVKAALLKEVPKEKDNAEDGAKKEDGKDRMTCVGQYLQSGRASFGRAKWGSNEKMPCAVHRSIYPVWPGHAGGPLGGLTKKGHVRWLHIFERGSHGSGLKTSPSLSISLLTASCGRVSSAFFPASFCNWLPLFGGFRRLQFPRLQFPKTATEKAFVSCVDLMGANHMTPAYLNFGASCLEVGTSAFAN